MGNRLSIDPNKSADHAGHDHSGHIEAVEITRLLFPRKPRKGHPETVPSELSFSGRPVSKRSRARGVRVAFVEEGEQLPQPALDPETGRIDLFYSKSSYREVHALLTSRSARLCYFWSSADGSSRLAWLLTSQV